MLGPMERSLGSRVRRLLEGLAPRGARAAPAPTAISYAPQPDGDPDPGEVVWAWIPYEEDPTTGKDRPALVIGWSGDRLATVPLSSKDHSDRVDAGEWIAVGSGPWDASGRPSFADAARLVPLDPASVRREGAALPRARFDEVVARVCALHGWTSDR